MSGLRSPAGSHIRTPNEVAIFLEGKSREEMIPLLKEWQAEIRRVERADAFSEGVAAASYEYDTWEE